MPTIALIRTIREQLADDPYWKQRLGALFASGARQHVHLAILLEPFLTYLLDGHKRVESRFSERRIAPFGRVRPGDLILLKKSGGPIVGVCEASAAWSFRIMPRDWRSIRRLLTAPLCVEGNKFWIDRASANFVTLIAITQAQRITPIDYRKRDRRGWLVWST